MPANGELQIARVLPMTIILTLVMLLSMAGPAAAQESAVAPAGKVPAAPSQGPTDPAELEAFLDDLFARQLEENHIAGAAVSVVKDGELLFARGYGYADLENSIPVDAEQTTFRIGSVSKLFTATAVMQLVEQGKLGLDADINSYLDFRISDTYPQSITLKHLLIYTAGFEDRIYESLATRPEDLVPAREWLVSHMHARVRPPGDVAAYSNYSLSRAGYIVARVSGLPYDQYVEQYILNPLGMAGTTARTPLPPELQARSSLGYIYANGDFQVYPDYNGQPGIVPGGGMQASATDMARFMLAHLNGGRYSDATIAEARILKESTAQHMHGTLFTHHPRILGTAYSFFDFSENGLWTIGHSGEAPPINSLLLLLPEQNLGLFVVYNSDSGELTDQHLGFQRAFFDHYYPATAPEPIQPPADFAERAGRFTGAYGVTRGSATNLEKVYGLLGTVDISVSGDGALLMATPWGDWRFVEVEPLYFRQVDSNFGIAFREDERGRITHLFTDLTPQFAFEKLDWYETPAFNIGLALGSIVLFLSIIPVVAVRFVLSHRLRGERKPAPAGARAAAWIIVGISVLNLLFVAGTALWGIAPPLFGVATVYQIVLGLGVLAAVLTLGAVVATALAWKNGYWGVARRGYYTLVTVAAVAFVWFLNYWNLLGWRF